MLLRLRIARRRAVTLIEAVLFISIALGLIIGGLVFYQQANTARQTQETLRLVSALVAEARSLTRNSGEVTGNLGIVLHAAGAVPSSAWDEAAQHVTSPWGGTIEILAQDADIPGTLIRVTFVDMAGLDPIPKEVCSRIVVFDAETGSGALGNGIAYVEMNGLNLYGGILWAPSEKFADAFNASSSGGANDISTGLDPSLAGQYCKALADFPFGYRLQVGFWLES
jgi:hypothetical protein